MNQPIEIKNLNNEKREFRDLFLKYFGFWPFFLLSFFIFLSAAFIILRYTEVKYDVVAKIEILDKAQDSEMALPTSMTIFNRSMINLENEIGIITSTSLHKKVVNELSSNIKFYTEGRIKKIENHSSQFFKDYTIDFKIKPNEIGKISTFNFTIENSTLNIEELAFDGKSVNKYSFKTLNTYNSNHNLPFDIEIKEYIDDFSLKSIVFFPFDAIASSFAGSIRVEETGLSSDQLIISLTHPNVIIANEYVNTLISEFDKDGITDRQLEYKRTIEFVDIRSKILEKELEKIELRKQNFKEENNITDIEQNAEVNIRQQFIYDQELASLISQKELVGIFKQILEEDITENELIPADIGIQSDVINSFVYEYNELVKKRERFLFSAGSNNYIVKTVEKQIKDVFDNIVLSVNNYDLSLQRKVQNSKSKESEFANIFQSIPKNEKILRSIQRELEIKESLFLLLLQKKEEAAINYAVVKPSIKVVDFSQDTGQPVSPNKPLVYFIALIFGFSVPFGTLYLLFIFDNKIRNRKHVTEIFGNEIPLVGEIPFIESNNSVSTQSVQDVRSPAAEAFRILLSNLNYSFVDKDNNSNKSILVTSSIKGEGKTFIALNIANLLASRDKKVLLIGCDLRNPQLHKYFQIDKNRKGLSNYLTNSKDHDIDEIINNFDNNSTHKNLDVILSGPIPPNPTILLESDRFNKLINDLKSKYDYIIIDSAPCLLVSDTFLISKYADLSVYALRAGRTPIDISEFILENYNKQKLNRMNLVLNGIGKNSAYGYKYSYKYNYKYSYNYAYNYGYGYGYGSEENSKN